jgi:hypothetical protein
VSVQGGGGGIGDPGERKPEDLTLDLREGYVTADGARAYTRGKSR